MSDYISREAAIALAREGRLVSNSNFKSVCDAIRSIPAADVRPVPEGGIGEMSDGYHTFNGLYYQRMALFAALVKAHTDIWSNTITTDYVKIGETIVHKSDVRFIPKTNADSIRRMTDEELQKAVLRLEDESGILDELPMVDQSTLCLCDTCAHKGNVDFDYCHICNNEADMYKPKPPKEG